MLFSLYSTLTEHQSTNGIVYSNKNNYSLFSSRKQLLNCPRNAILLQVTRYHFYIKAIKHYGGYCMKKKFSTIAIFTLAILVCALAFFNTNSERSVEITGEIDVLSRVIYLDNDAFPDNTVSGELSFLMPFTDYVEIGNRLSLFSANDMEVYYNYISSLRFVINYTDPNIRSIEQIVFEMDVPLSELQGTLITEPPRPRRQGDETHDNEVDSDWGNDDWDEDDWNEDIWLDDGWYDNYSEWNVYRFYPKEYLTMFQDFISALEQQMYIDGIYLPSSSDDSDETYMDRFGANLFILFEYEVYIPESNFSETIINEYRMSLSESVYFLSNYGYETLESSISIVDSTLQPNILMLFISVLLFALGFYWVIRSRTKNLPQQPLPQNMSKSILRKYTNEVLILSEPLPLDGYTKVQVNDFGTLLKMSIVSNKQITFFENNTCGEFILVVDTFAYAYQVAYDA